MPMIVFKLTQWGQAAERHLRDALDEIQSGEDAIPSVSAALACLRIEVGELPPDADLLGGDAAGTPSSATSGVTSARQPQYDVQPCGQRHAGYAPCTQCNDLCGAAMDAAAQHLDAAGTPGG